MYDLSICDLYIVYGIALFLWFLLAWLGYTKYKCKKGSKETVPSSASNSHKW